MLESLREDRKENRRFVPAAFELFDTDARGRTYKFPVGDDSFGGSDAVAVLEVLTQAARKVGVFGGFLAGNRGYGGVAVDVAYEVDCCRGDVGGVWFELFDDLVDDHYVLTVGEAQADRFPSPNLFPAEVDAVVGAFPGSCCVVAQGLDEGETVVYHFSGKDAAIYFGFANAVAAFKN